MKNSTPVWMESDDTCALSDGERHLGHATRSGNHWYAFDGTRLNREGTHFRALGSFTSVDSAKRAIEEATVVSKTVQRVFRAGS